MSMHERLSEAMKRQDVTQAQLARMLDVSPASVSAWCKGTKRPTTPNLVDIAARLGVTPGYLQFGDTTVKSRSSADQAQGRADYQAALQWYWRPAPRDHGREYGNAAGYAFEPSIEALARESAQNISDEKLNTEPTVESRYTVMELSGPSLGKFLDRLKFDQVREHLEAASQVSRKAGSVIERGLAQVDDGRLMVIRIEDFYANGLTGPEFKTGRYMAVVRNLLDSQKGERSGGSFGLGKATLWSSSQFGLVLVNSTLSEAVDGQTSGRFIGRIDLPWHETDPSMEWAGPGWFGLEDPDEDEEPRRTISYWGNEVAHEDFYVDRPEGLTGTSFLIVGAYDASGRLETVEEIAEKFSESLADSFWPAMVDRPDDTPARFRAIVRAQRNDKLVSETYVNPSHYQPARVAAFTRHLEDEVVDQLEEAGDVVRVPITLEVPARTGEPIHEAVDHEAMLLVCEASDIDPGARSATSPNRVSLMRGSQMVIRSQLVGALPVGARTFYAMLLAGEAAEDGPADRAADRFLRAAEPPAHDEWRGTPDLTANYAKGGVAALERFDAAIKKAIREIIRQPSKDLSDGPNALKELLRIVPPKAEGKRPRVKSVKAHSIDEHGAWVITEATVTLPPRKDGKGWTITPVLRFGTESGAGIPVEWKDLQPISKCERDERGRLTTKPKDRTAKFSAISKPDSHPVGAKRATISIDVRVHQSQGAES